MGVLLATYDFVVPAVAANGVWLSPTPIAIPPEAGSVLWACEPGGSGALSGLQVAVDQAGPFTELVGVGASTAGTMSVFKTMFALPWMKFFVKAQLGGSYPGGKAHLRVLTTKP